MNYISIIIKFKSIFSLFLFTNFPNLCLKFLITYCGKVLTLHHRWLSWLDLNISCSNRDNHFPNALYRFKIDLVFGFKSYTIAESLYYVNYGLSIITSKVSQIV